MNPITGAGNPGRAPKIEVIAEEHHTFPANRPGIEDRPLNPNARARGEGQATGQRLSPQEKLDASREAKRLAQSGTQIGDSARSLIDKLPPGHPMRAQLEAQAGLQQATTSKKRPLFSTARKPSRLQLERQRKGVQDDTPPTRSAAEVDPNYQTIGLPSQFKFYDTKDLSVRCLKGVHQAKLSRAAKDGKLRYVVEAISSTLGSGFSAFDLTPQDFYFLMYWHRLQSFPKNPQMIPYTCTNTEHVRRTLLRKEHKDFLDAETLDISTILTDTTLKTEYLDELDLSQWQELIDKYDLHVETMRDIVEFAELQEEEAYFQEQLDEEELGETQTTATVEQESDESFTEVEWLQERSVYLRRGPGRNTILERNEIIKEMSADEILSLDKYIEAVTNYGVSESTILRCKECGASHRVKLSVDALTFLP